MNYTEKYHLPQWEDSDRVMRTDFNQMCVNIENGIKEVKSEAQKAQTDVDGLARTVKSQGETLSAHEHCVMGTFTGSMYATVVTLGFRPKAVYIAKVYTTRDVEDAAGACGLFMDGVSNSTLVFRDDGFSLYSGDSGTYPRLNSRNMPYIYIAFK